MKELVFETFICRKYINYGCANTDILKYE